MTWEEACQILGVAVTATTAEVDKVHLQKEWIFHPDRMVGAPESARQRAEEELKRVNEAYNFLKDPKNRSQGSPPKLSVSPQRIRFKDVKLGQRKTTTIRIESVGGSYTKFWMDDSPAAWLKVVEVKSTTNDPLPLEATLEATGNSSSHGQTGCSLLIRLEDEKSKAKDEVTVKIELWMRSTARSGILGWIFGRAKSSPPQPTYVPPVSSPQKPRHGVGPSLTTNEPYHRVLPDHNWHNDLTWGQLPDWIRRDPRLIARLRHGRLVTGKNVLYRAVGGKLERRLRYHVSVL
jgi:hypothetical protein